MNERLGRALEGNIAEPKVRVTPSFDVYVQSEVHPFEPISSQLKACEGSDRIEIIPMGSFWLEKLIGDLCYSINRMKPGALQIRLLDLCDRLEAAERYGDGMLDEF